MEKVSQILNQKTESAKSGIAVCVCACDARLKMVLKQERFFLSFFVVGKEKCRKQKIVKRTQLFIMKIVFCCCCWVA
jgi:hypothetical protein